MSTEIDTVPDAPRALKRVEGADDTSLDGRHRYAKALATGHDVIPKGLWSPVRRPDGTMGPPEPSAGKILIVTEIARMLGFHPLAGIMGVHIIEGKPSISPAMMSAKVRTAGHRLRVGIRGTVEEGNLTAFARLARSDDPDFEYVVEWTLADAQRATLGTLARSGGGFTWTATKDNWRKYPRAMLKARAIAEVCREGAEDVLMGAAYIPDELGANTTEDGDALDAAPRKPERDWVAEIDAATDLDTLVEIREALRKSPDYAAGLWGHLVTRYGAMAAADEEPVEGETEEPSGPEETHDGVDESEAVDAEVVHEDTASAEDSASGVDDPDWTGPDCPRCSGKHDASVHDGDDE